MISARDYFKNFTICLQRFYLSSFNDLPPDTTDPYVQLSSGSAEDKPDKVVVKPMVRMGSKIPLRIPSNSKGSPGRVEPSSSGTSVPPPKKCESNSRARMAFLKAYVSLMNLGGSDKPDINENREEEEVDREYVTTPEAEKLVRSSSSGKLASRRASITKEEFLRKLDKDLSASDKHSEPNFVQDKPLDKIPPPPAVLQIDTSCAQVSTKVRRSGTEIGISSPTPACCAPIRSERSRTYRNLALIGLCLIFLVGFVKSSSTN